jgi:hypothetical protein
VKGEKIAFLGNSQAERLNLSGNFETYRHLQFPDPRFGGSHLWTAGGRSRRPNQRLADYTAIDDPLKVFRRGHTAFASSGSMNPYAGVRNL